MLSKTKIGQEDLEKVAFVLKTIAHPTRLAIIDLLAKEGRKTVSEICSELSIEQSLASHHLNTMKLKSVLGSMREGKNIYYFLKLDEVTQIIGCIESCDLKFTI